MAPSSDLNDLSSCDLEQIQFLGRIQPHGFLMYVSADWLVSRVSQNLGDFLPIAAADALGRPLTEVLGRDAVHDIRGHLQAQASHRSMQRLFGVAVLAGRGRFDIAVNRCGEFTMIECEPHEPADEGVATTMQPLLMQLRDVETFDRLCSLVARQMRALSGFDRVMTYRFHPDGSGEVIAETRRSGLEAFKGLRYPATDIPKQARALYERYPIRMIADVDAATVPVLPMVDPSGERLDLSPSVLRAVSPIHLEYLRNMGVAASLSISILIDGKLWGLIACHHQRPRALSLQARTALEFLGQMFSTLLQSMARAEDLARQQSSRTLHASLLSALSGETASMDDVGAQFRQVQELLSADGFATFVEGRLRLAGMTPTHDQTLELMQFLNLAVASKIYSTHCLSSVHPAAAAYADIASGLIAVPVSRKPRDHVVFFRRELVRQVTWAGEPSKAVQVSDSGLRLSPRKSFAAWRETVRGQSAYWSGSDRRAAEALRVTLIEIMLQVTDRAEKQRKLSNDQQDLLIAELNHRVRNILNLIVGLVRQCSDGATSPRELADEISARVHALARAHDQLTSSGWGARSFSTMIKVEAGAYLGTRIERVTILGPDVRIQPDAFATLALVMHELITNAVKYGALRGSRGMVEVGLERDEAGGLVIEWREHGGGPIGEPKRRGFGSTIIERAIPHELSGTSEIRFEPGGLRARFTVPAVYIAEPGEPESGVFGVAEPEPASSDQIAGSVLLVEDNLLIALETEDALYGLGAEDVHIASTVGSALAYLRDSKPDFAVLDYNLGREQSVAVADRLADMGTPFVFATGYGDTSTIESRFRSRPILTKPYTARTILGAFNAVVPPAALR